MYSAIAARLYFAFIAASAIGISLAAGACSPAGPTLPTAAPSTDVPPASSAAYARLALSAISTRSRIARANKRPTETVSRTYDRNGKVVGEWVLLAGKWTERASTLPVALESRPLTDFMNTGGANLITGRVDTASWVDSNSVVSHEQLTTDSAAAIQLLDHNGGSVYGTASGEVYYDAPSYLANPATSAAGVMYFCSTGPSCDDVFEELEISGTDWAAVVADASASLRSGFSTAPAFSASGSCVGESAEVTGHGSTPTTPVKQVATPLGRGSIMMMTQQDPCMSLKYAAGAAIGTFVVNGVATVACSSLLAWLCGPAVPLLAANINRTGAAAVIAETLFGVCRYNHPIGSW